MRRGQHPGAAPEEEPTPGTPSLLGGTDVPGKPGRLFGNRCHQLGGSDSVAATCEPRSGRREQRGASNLQMCQEHSWLREVLPQPASGIHLFLCVPSSRGDGAGVSSRKGRKDSPDT